MEVLLLSYKNLQFCHGFSHMTIISHPLWSIEVKGIAKETESKATITFTRSKNN